MEGTLVFLAILDRLQEDRIFEESAILNGEGDTGEVLIDNASGTEGHVADFAVAGSVPGETDRNPRCLESDHRIETAYLIECWESGFFDGVALNAIGETPAIENDENDGFVWFHVCF